MKKTKRIFAFALALLLAALMLTGCKSTLTSLAHKLTGASDEVQEEDTTQWAAPSRDPLLIERITVSRGTPLEAFQAACQTADVSE